MSRTPPCPVTPAVRFLREHGIPFEPHIYRYFEHGGTAAASAALGVPEHAVIKTLVMEDERGNGLVILMHGDCEVSTRELARALRVRSIAPSDPAAAARRTGYLVGGTSPFGMRTPLPLYAEASIFTLPRVYVNGGKRGFLVAVAPEALRAPGGLTSVSVAIPVRPEPRGGR